MPIRIGIDTGGTFPHIVLADDDGARANMTASWLAQMAWEVYVVQDPAASAFSQTGPWRPNGPTGPRFGRPSIDQRCGSSTSRPNRSRRPRRPSTSCRSR